MNSEELQAAYGGTWTEATDGWLELRQDGKVVGIVPIRRVDWTDDEEWQDFAKWCDEDPAVMTMQDLVRKEGKR